MNAHATIQHPAGGWILHTLPQLIGLGVDEDAACLHVALGRGQLVSARALLTRYHGRWIGLGQGGLGCAPGCRNSGDPLARRLGQHLKGGLTI
jgi:hypothetical protein